MRSAADARVAGSPANAEAGSFGAWPPRTAHRRPVSAEGDETSREASGYNAATCVCRRDIVRAADGAGIGPVMTVSRVIAGGHADWFGKLRLRAKTPRRRLDASMTPPKATHTGEKKSQAAARERDLPAQANGAAR